MIKRKDKFFSWFVGFWEGEGSLSLVKLKSGVVRGNLTVYQKQTGVLKRIQAELGGYISTLIVDRKTKRKMSRIVRRWKETRPMLLKMLPLMHHPTKIKKVRRALAVLSRTPVRKYH